MTVNHWVAGSSPAGGANFFIYLQRVAIRSPFLFSRLRKLFSTCLANDSQTLDFDCYEPTVIRGSVVGSGLTMVMLIGGDSIHHAPYGSIGKELTSTKTNLFRQLLFYRTPFFQQQKLYMGLL